MKLPDTTRVLIHDTAAKLEAVYNEAYPHSSVT